MQKVKKFKLAIITTHPIQYYAPVFRLLNERGNVDIHVFYTSYQDLNKYDAGFKRDVKWDISLLDGYPYTIVENVSATPGSHRFLGADNPGLIQLIKNFSPDAILVYGWAYKSHLQVLRYFKGKTAVWFRGDSTLLDKSQWFKRWMRNILLKWVYKHIDKAFYVGSANKDYFLKYGLKDSQLFFAPHAVDNGRFAIDRTAEATELRRKLGVGYNDILILFAGKFEQKKSPVELLMAFKTITNKGIHLLFTGNGNLEEKLKREAEGLSGIHFHDFVNQSDIPVHYQACDLFCLPSGGPGETWGLAVNEAMAAGKAVLVSDKAGCTGDVVRNNQNGKIFVSGTQNGLQSALTELISNKVKLIDMGQKSAQIIQEYSFINQVMVIEEQCHV